MRRFHADPARIQHFALPNMIAVLRSGESSGVDHGRVLEADNFNPQRSRLRDTFTFSHLMDLGVSERHQLRLTDLTSLRQTGQGPGPRRSP